VDLPSREMLEAKLHEATRLARAGGEKPIGSGKTDCRIINQETI